MYCVQLSRPRKTLVSQADMLAEKKYQILQEIITSMAAGYNIGTVANLMLDLAISYTNAVKGSVMLLDERGELSIFAAKGLDMALLSSYRAKLGEGIIGSVAEKGEPVLVHDIHTDARFSGMQRDLYKTTSFISCPIVSKRKLLALLNINDKEGGTSFTNDEFELVKIIGSQAAIALENASLMVQLRGKAAELEEANKKLMEQDVAKTESLTQVAHELRTPLNSVRGAVFHLQQARSIGRGEQQEFLEIMAGETEKLIRITDNMLEYLRFGDETRLIKRSIIDLPDLVRDFLDSALLRSELGKKNLKIEARVPENISSITGDRIKVVQFLMNIVTGMGAYLDRDESLSIQVDENDRVLVTVAVAHGLPEEAARAFEQSEDFYHPGPPETLKLYLARRIADAHRWELAIQSDEDSFAVNLGIPKRIREKTEAFVDTTAELLLDFVSGLMDVNTCSILLADDLTGDLTIRSARGLDDDVVRKTRIRVGDRISGWVAMEGRSLLVEDIETDPVFRRKNVAQYNTKSFLSVPLKVDDRVLGVLNLNNKNSSEPFTARDRELAELLGERISRFIERLHAGNYRETDIKGFIGSFYNLLEAERKHHKRKHHLPNLMFGVLDALGASASQKRTGLYVSMIYDLGLMLVDDSILRKSVQLSPSQARALKVHPYTTVDLLKEFEFSDDVKQAVLHHHEHYDGSGYPDGLKGEDIPFLARVLATVDAYCAMIQERAYRPRFEHKDALEEIRGQAGIVYDANVVRALEAVLGND